MDPVTHPNAPLGGREGVERAPGVAPLAGVGLAPDRWRACVRNVPPSSSRLRCGPSQRRARALSPVSTPCAPGPMESVAPTAQWVLTFSM